MPNNVDTCKTSTHVKHRHINLCWRKECDVGLPHHRHEGTISMAVTIGFFFWRLHKWNGREILRELSLVMLRFNGWTSLKSKVSTSKTWYCTSQSEIESRRSMHCTQGDAKLWLWLRTSLSHNEIGFDYVILNWSDVKLTYNLRITKKPSLRNTGRIRGFRYLRRIS